MRGGTGKKDIVINEERVHLAIYTIYIMHYLEI